MQVPQNVDENTVVLPRVIKMLVDARREVCACVCLCVCVVVCVCVCLCATCSRCVFTCLCAYAYLFTCSPAAHVFVPRR
jgi:hypothetical protein